MLIGMTPAIARSVSVVLLLWLLPETASAQSGAQAAGENEAGGADDAQASAASTQAPPDRWRSVTFGAAFEGYYQFDSNHPPDRRLALRAYDTRSNTFSIQQAALVVDAAPDPDAGRRHGLRVDLQFGQATETLQGSAANEPRPDAYRHVWQAFGSYLFPVGAQGLQADFGKFGSILGIETNYAKDNQAFTRALLFDFLPFYHAGLRVTLPVNQKLSLLYMLTNGIQETEDFNDFKSNHFAAVVKPVPMATWTINYYLGQEQPDGGQPGGPDGFFRVFDTYLTLTPTAALTLGADINHATSEVNRHDAAASLRGLAGYARYQVTPPLGFGVRYERLDDEGLFGGIEQLLQETTITAEYKLSDGFLFRAEWRLDWSNIAFFPARGGAADRRRGQNTALVGGIWTIGNKQGVW
jgi:putative OmpL-like beta-barrel porin-2